MDADGVVAALNRAQGDTLRIIGPCTGGETGAWLVRDEAGVRLVLKWWDEVPGRVVRLQAVERRTERLRRLGYPIPGVDRLVAVDGVIAQLQQERPGRPLDSVTPAILDRLLELNERQAGQATGEGRPFGPYLIGTLVVGADGYCIHEPLQLHSPRSAALLDCIREIGSASRRVSFRSVDAMHLDFHHRNVLGEAGSITAVIDWDGCRDGDRWFDLACLSFQIDLRAVGPDVSDKLRAHVEGNVEPDTLLAYRAHLVLRQVDWSIRLYDDDVVEHDLAFGAELLGTAPATT